MNKLTPQKEKEALRHRVTKIMHPMFKNNPGKTGMIFNEHHPYFDVPDEYKYLAKQNFNLTIPENDDNV